MGEVLRKSLNLPPDEKLVLVYLGAWGDALTEGAIEPLPGVTYLSFHPLPSPVRMIDPDSWSFHDVLAGVDVVLAKPGYGIAAAVLAHGVRLIHHSRAEFAEYPALQAALRDHGNDQCISLDDLESGRWSGSVKEALDLHRPKAEPAPGASATAKVVEAVLGIKPLADPSVANV
jgi:hypothetical protein